MIEKKDLDPVAVAEDKPKLTDAQLRCRQAAEEIRVILEAYDAELFPVMMISPKGILGTTIDIVPKQPKPQIQAEVPPVGPPIEPPKADAEFVTAIEPPCDCDDECTGECVGTDEPAVPDSAA